MPNKERISQLEETMSEALKRIDQTLAELRQSDVRQQVMLQQTETNSAIMRRLEITKAALATWKSPAPARQPSAPAHLPFHSQPCLTGLFLPKTLEERRPVLDLSYRDDVCFIINRILRPLAPTEAQEAYALMLDAARSHGCQHWLIDLRRHSTSAEATHHVLSPAPRPARQADVSGLPGVAGAAR